MSLLSAAASSRTRRSWRRPWDRGSRREVTYVLATDDLPTTRLMRPHGSADSGCVLRVDNKIEIVLVPWSLGSVFRGRYAAKAGDRTYLVRWNRKALEAILSKQRETPVALLCEGRRALWLFHGSFWWEDDDVSCADVRALVLRREQKLRQPVVDEAPGEDARRPPLSALPARVPVTGFERVGGRCVDCGSHFWPWASDEHCCNRCAQTALAA